MFNQLNIPDISSFIIALKGMHNYVSQQEYISRGWGAVKL